MINSNCYREGVYDPLQDLPGYALRRASAVQMAVFGAQLAPLGLTVIEASILTVVKVNPGASLSAIGRMLDVQRANMTPLVARLESKGLVERTIINGRSFGLRLSPSGGELQSRLAAAIEAHERSVAEAVPPEHRAALLPILHALWRAV